MCLCHQAVPSSIIWCWCKSWEGTIWNRCGLSSTTWAQAKDQWWAAHRDVTVCVCSYADEWAKLPAWHLQGSDIKGCGAPSIKSLCRSWNDDVHWMVFIGWYQCCEFPSVHWYCLFGESKGNVYVKTCPIGFLGREWEEGQPKQEEKRPVKHWACIIVTHTKGRQALTHIQAYTFYAVNFLFQIYFWFGCIPFGDNLSRVFTDWMPDILHILSPSSPTNSIKVLMLRKNSGETTADNKEIKLPTDNGYCQKGQLP